ncbi:hypothetical protein K2X30_00285 [bacterium]|nr:hypothetical protein [bacterium]
MRILILSVVLCLFSGAAFAQESDEAARSSVQLLSPVPFKCKAVCAVVRGTWSIPNRGKIEILGTKEVNTHLFSSQYDQDIISDDGAFTYVLTPDSDSGNVTNQFLAACRKYEEEVTVNLPLGSTQAVIFTQVQFSAQGGKNYIDAYTVGSPRSQCELFSHESRQ